MIFPTKVCVVCSEEFELKPDKPGFANRCPRAAILKRMSPQPRPAWTPYERKTVTDANEARRQAMRELLYRKDS